jgi:hypothetical protein
MTEFVLQLGPYGYDVSVPGRLALGPPKPNDLLEEPLLPFVRGHAPRVAKVSIFPT